MMQQPGSSASYTSQNSRVVAGPPVKISGLPAIIVPKPGQRPEPDALVKYTKERLASYKAPTYFTFVEELPRNPMGKVLKTELRKLYGKPGNA